MPTAYPQCFVDDLIIDESKMVQLVDIQKQPFKSYWEKNFRMVIGGYGEEVSASVEFDVACPVLSLGKLIAERLYGHTRRASELHG